MQIIEVKEDLFNLPKREYVFAHCIASDLGMGAGIAVEMNKQFRLREALKKSGNSLTAPTCIYVNNVLNLITKSKSNGKPTYNSMTRAINKMTSIVMENDIYQIAMPKIGAGLDRLSWPKVREIIENDFQGLEVYIKVCYK